MTFSFALRRAALAVAAIALSTLPADAQEKSPSADPLHGGRQVIDLWEGVPAGSEKWTQQEYYVKGGENLFLRNVSKPSITVFPANPAKANGTGVVIAPGGGFYMLSWTHEGTSVAEWLAERGVTCFVLKYRTTDTTPDAPNAISEAAGRPVSAKPSEPKAFPSREEVIKLAGEDGRQAVRIVRERAAEWKLDPNRIGFLGFSAGGGVTMNVVMDNDERSRPSFAVPIYGGGFEVAPPPANACPLFIVCASDDKGAAARCVKTYEAWLTAGKPCELHMYAKGGHGFGTRQQKLPVDSWLERCEEWMAQQGFMPTPSPAK